MAIKNLPNFKEQLLNFTQIEVPNKAMGLQMDIAFHLIQKIQEKTPVDTGFAVSNWRMAVDRIPSGTLGTYEGAFKDKMQHNLSYTSRDRLKTTSPNYSKHRPDYNPAPFVARRARKYQELNVDALYKSVKGELVRQYWAKDWNRIGHIVYIFNNVKYIQVLEDGHSTKAPLGMVRVSIEETRAWLAARGK